MDPDPGSKKRPERKKSLHGKYYIYFFQSLFTILIFKKKITNKYKIFYFLHFRLIFCDFCVLDPDLDPGGLPYCGSGSASLYTNCGNVLVILTLFAQCTVLYMLDNPIPLFSDTSAQAACIFPLFPSFLSYLNYQGVLVCLSIPKID